MNVTINAKILAHELRAFDKIVAAKPTIPVLSNILFETKDGQLQLSATDLEVGLISTCPATIGEPGSITLPAKKFLAMADEFPDGDVHRTLDKGQVRVSTGTFVSRLQTIPVSEFPTLHAAEGQVSALPGAMLTTLIKRTRYAIPQGGSAKFTIEGACLELRPDGNAAMISTDGRRMALATGKWPGGPNKIVTIIPAKTLDVLLALDVTKDYEFSQSENHLFFVSETRTLFSRVIDKKFPDYGKAIPKFADATKKASVNRQELAAALRRVGLVAETNKATILDFAVGLQPNTGVISLAAQSVGVGQADESIEIAYEGDPIRVCVNYEFITDFLSAAVGQDVNILMTTDKLPILLTDADFMNVLLAMKV